MRLYHPKIFQILKFCPKTKIQDFHYICMLIHCAAPPTYKRDLDRVRTPLFFKTTTTTNNITHGKEFHGQALETLLEFHEYTAGYLLLIPGRLALGGFQKLCG